MATVRDKCHSHATQIKCHLNADHKGKAHSNNTHKYLMSTKISYMYAIVQHIYDFCFFNCFIIIFLII